MLAFPRPGRDTGPGRVTQVLRTQPGDPRSSIIDDYWLWNFNFDGNVPKLAHERHMSAMIKTLHARPSHLRIGGYADKTGNFIYNQRLSESRALMVKDWFLERGVSEAQVPGTELSAFGEIFSQNTKAFAKSDKEKDAYFRAVNVQVHVGLRNKPINIPEPVDPTVIFKPHWWHDVIVGRVPKAVPPPVRDDTVPSRRWSVKYLEGFSGSAGAGGLGFGASATMETSKLLFYNHETGMHHVARVTTSGFAAGVAVPIKIEGFPVLPNMAYTDTGDWRTFQLSEPKSYKDFEGDVTWSAASGTDAELKPEGFSDTIHVSTGPTYNLIPSAGSGGKSVGILNITPGMTGVSDRP